MDWFFDMIGISAFCIKDKFGTFVPKFKSFDFMTAITECVSVTAISEQIKITYHHNIKRIEPVKTTFAAF